MTRWPLGVAALALLLAGCAAPAEPPPTAPPTPGTGLPPRPVTLSFAGIDPCTLLTPAQQAELGVGLGHRNDQKAQPSADPSPQPEGPACDWTTNQPRRQISHRALLDTKIGAEFALGAEPLRTVGGYAATTTSSAIADPRWLCYVLIDTGPGQSLSSQYSVETKDIPGMTHEKACDIAQTAGEMMLANLRAAQPPGPR